MRDSVVIGEIQKNVRIPEARSRYPWASMDIGDSFLVSSGELDANQLRGRVSSAVRNYHKHHNDARFTVRRVPSGIRVWRAK